jgi:hypothetical protein
MTTERPEVIQVRPDPGPEIVRAIEQAVQDLWPKPVPAAPEEVPAWRFSGRWWSQPAALRRDRPLSTI